jgi:hypothetical protein
LLLLLHAAKPYLLPMLLPTAFYRFLLLPAAVAAMPLAAPCCFFNLQC